MLTIDGSEGEGGGQVLRTALALSAVTGRSFRIERIRGKRNKPGLLRQHLTAVRAAAEICDARVSGDELGSSSLSFEPKRVKHGDYNFAVGTAGSAMLVLQTVLPPLLMAEGRSRVVIEGGTHNSMSPPFDFIAQTFLPLLHRMGGSATIALGRHGFYPAGGGRIEAHIAGGGSLVPLQLMDRGQVHGLKIRATVAQIPEHIAGREARGLASALCDHPLDFETETVESAGPGNVATVTVRADALVETFTGFGEKGVRAETVAHRLAGEVRKYLASDAPVGEHLADQLLVPLALAGGGMFRTTEPSLHTTTNADVIARFLPVRIAVERDVSAWMVQLRR